MGASDHEATVAEVVFHPKTGKPVCGANSPKSANPYKICLRAPGWGTPHPGFGRCRYHFGCTLAGNARANTIQAKLEGLRLFGQEEDIDPGTALLWLVRRTAGICYWLDTKIAAMQDENDLTQWVAIGDGGHRAESVWVKMYAEERERLGKFCKMALDAGVAERIVRLEEQKGQLLAGAIQQILDGLKLTKQQQANAPALVRRVLTAIPTTSSVLDTSTQEGTDE